MSLGILLGRHETTATQIDLSLLALLAHPAQLARLRSDPGLLPGAVEEFMRFVPLSASLPPARVTAADVTLGGVTIPAGEMVFPVFAIANRDPSVFPDPDTLDVTRAPSTPRGIRHRRPPLPRRATGSDRDAGGVPRPARPASRAASGRRGRRSALEGKHGHHQRAGAAGDLGPLGCRPVDNAVGRGPGCQAGARAGPGRSPGRAGARARAGAGRQAGPGRAGPGCQAGARAGPGACPSRGGSLGRAGVPGRGACRAGRVPEPGRVARPGQARPGPMC